MDDRQEREVAQGLRQGRPEAWQALYEAYAEQVWRAVARLLGSDAADVADVVQETFLAAARGAAAYDPTRGSLWMWLWGIARNHVALHRRKQGQFDRLRRAGAWLASGDGAVLGYLRGRDSPLPEEALASAELATLVRATLTDLPDEYGLLLTAKYLDDLPVEDIARQTRSTSSAVRSKLARARQAFREAFERHTTLSASPPAGSDTPLRGRPS
jgi:RNA polymerase sigma-70 factor (ECF subfamily)